MDVPQGELSKAELDLCRLWEELVTVRRLGDKAAESAALCETTKVLCELKRFDEAVSCCRQRVALCTTLADPREHCSVLYNIASVHHARGKHLLLMSGPFGGRAIRESMNALKLAVNYYRAHLRFARQLQQRAAEGKTLGHLGNVLCLLGNFSSAHKYMEARLMVAYELGDLHAQRRVCTNLANAHMLQGNLTQAAGFHCKALEVAIRMKNRVLEAQCYFSLGTVHLMAHNHTKALDNLRKHLELAQEMEDVEGESLSYWAIGKALTSLGKLQSALICATHHLNLASKLHREGDVAIAKKNVADLGKALALQNKSTWRRPLRHTWNDSVHWRRRKLKEDDREKPISLL